MKTKVVFTSSLDPWHNLALEEYLLDSVEKDECILYLWQNQNTVVIGKNQNAWQECRTELLEREGGKLARRSSGGGAVFHDTGNLNFSFLIDREFYDVHRQLEVILRALMKLGINAKFSGRNDLVVDDKKFSGNAFSFRKTSALHHGTILISTDMDKMARYLQVSKEKIQSKGIKSVRSRVVNLIEYAPGLNIEKTKEAIVQAFGEIYGKPDAILDEKEYVDPIKLEPLVKKYASWEWRYGESPKFDIEFKTRFSWGGIEICLRLVRGRIEKAWVYSDAMDEKFIEMLPKTLEGCLFNTQSISNALYGMDVDDARKSMIADIANWIESKDF